MFQSNAEKAIIELDEMDSILRVNPKLDIVDEFEDNNDYVELLDDSAIRSNEHICDNAEQTTFYSKSEFYIEFSIITNNGDINENLSDNKVSNVYFNPKFILEILKIFVLYLSLWTPILKYSKNESHP